MVGDGDARQASSCSAASTLPPRKEEDRDRAAHAFTRDRGVASARTTQSCQLVTVTVTPHQWEWPIGAS
jgi:hypothetical protein